MEDKISRSLHWFRNDLRLDDNPALAQSLKYDETIPVYILDDHFWAKDRWGNIKTGPYRSGFLLESIHDLKIEIEKIGGSLIIKQGKPEEILPQLIQKFSCDILIAQAEHTSEEVEIENTVTDSINEIGVTCKWIEGHTLYHPEDIKILFDQIPDVFTTFRKIVEKNCEIRMCIPAPDKIKCPANLISDETPDLAEFLLQSGQKITPKDKRSSFPFKGGLSNARKRLKHYFWDNNHLSIYKKTRNQLFGQDFSSKFSPWLANGCISPRRIRSEVKRYENTFKPNQSTYWLVFELIWRDYFKFIALQHGRRIFYKNGIKRTKIQSNKNKVLYEKWKNGETSDAFVNANMRELLKTGYMSNRGRQNVASYLIHDLGIDWRLGASWFEHLLIDYDPSSNVGNWIYIAGVGNDPRPIRKFNTVRQAEIYDRKKQFRNLWKPNTLLLNL